MLARGWEGDPDSLRSGILQGMMRFVALYQGEYDPERLVKRLHTVHPMTLVRDEKSLSGTVRYKYMMLILRTYNGASRRRNLPIKPECYFPGPRGFFSLQRPPIGAAFAYIKRGASR